MSAQGYIKSSVRHVMATLDSLRIIGPDTVYDTEYYEKMNREAWLRDSEVFADVLLAEFDPESILSLGCGTGRNLSPFHRRGVDVHGVDGSKKAMENGMLPRDRLEHHDLRDPYRSEREHDLVLCIEVLEHIPAKYADTVVESIVSAGERLVVTAAEPGQGGTHHVNEQPHAYWKQKFEAHGATYCASESQSVVDRLDDIQELVWIPDNLMIFHR